uniref:G_PROTEIN_RECEP_F1_2 domain-containing protein n=1 Tax=Steinernema glaseri TaxID=37863 RepID=A0A1I7Z7G5_9BILA
MFSIIFPSDKSAKHQKFRNHNRNNRPLLSSYLMAIDAVTDAALVGTLATIVGLVNTPVIAIIFCSRNLRKCKELVLIGAICTVDAFMSWTSAVGVVDRVVSFPDGTGEPVLQIHCFFRYYVVLFFFGNLLVGMVTFLVSVERFFAVFFPLRYLSSYTRSKALAVILGEQVLQIHCFFRYYVVLFFFGNLLVGMVTFLVSVERFFAVFFPLRYLSSYTRSKAFAVILGLTCLSDMFLLFLPDLIINFNFFDLHAYHMIFYRASLVKTSLNLFIYTFRHNELRKEVKTRVFRCVN